MRESLLLRRREAVFGVAVLMAGTAITVLCFMPTLLAYGTMTSLFPTDQQERFFFDLFGIVCGCWLLSWVSAVNFWKGSARLGQWLGIILLCLDEAILIGVFRDISQQVGGQLRWLAPALVQSYLLGCFFGFFTLPSLTMNGNRTLTGLGTLVLILPWLLGKDSVILGTQFLHGMFP